MQFVCNSLQAFRFCSTAAPRVIPISQVPRHFGNSGYPCAVELIISISHVFSIFFYVSIFLSRFLLLFEHFLHYDLACLLFLKFTSV